MSLALGLFVYTVLLSTDLATVDNCKPDRDGYCTSAVVTGVVDSKHPVLTLKINVALKSAIVVSLDKSLDVTMEPISGNPDVFRIDTDKWKQNPHIVEIRTVPPVDMLKNKAKVSDIVYMPGDAHIYAGDFSVTLQMRIVGPTNPPINVNYVNITSPETAQMKSRAEEFIAKELSRRVAAIADKERALEATARSLSKRETALSLLRWRECNGFRFMRMRSASQRLALFGEFICRIGDDLVLGFTLENNRADTFHLKAIKVFGVEGSKQHDMQAQWVFADERTTVELGLDERMSGAAYFSLQGRGSDPSYTLEVTEEGGNKRVVRLADYRF